MSTTAWLRLKAEIKHRDNHTCLSCGATENLTIHHIVPKYRGGTSAPGNLQTLCFACNQLKGRKTIDFRTPHSTTGVPLTAIRTRIENLKKLKGYLK